MAANDELTIQALELLVNKANQAGQLLQKKNEVIMWKGQMISKIEDNNKSGFDTAISELFADILTIAGQLGGK